MDTVTNATTTTDTRTALLDAAEQLFSQKGYASVGTREIVETAGANLAAIKYHFGGKAELYLATVQRVMQRHEDDCAWKILEKAPVSPDEAAVLLIRFIRRFLEHMLTPPADDTVGCLILHEAAEPTDAIDFVVNDFIRPHKRTLTQTLTALAPGLSEEQLALHVESILGQILHYRTFHAFLARTDVGRLNAPDRLQTVAEHVARVALRGLNCPEEFVQRSIDTAATMIDSTQETQKP